MANLPSIGATVAEHPENPCGTDACRSVSETTTTAMVLLPGRLTTACRLRVPVRRDMVIDASGESELMRRRAMPIKTIIALTVVFSALSLQEPLAAQTSPPVAKDCSSVGDLSFVCGVSNVEDFLPVAGGRWLVGGSLRGLDPVPSTVDSAGLYLIDTAAKTARTVDLSAAAEPDSRYPGCSAPNLKRLNTHGLDVAAGPHHSTMVYAVNHDGRQSVEVFRLFPAKSAAEWVGCVVLPPGAVGNAVAAMVGGGFVVSKFIDDTDKDSMRHALSGQVTGAVYEWKPGMGFSEVPGTRLSGANGVLVSPDQQWLYVNAWGSHEIYRVPLSGSGKPSVAKVDFSPDNLRWTPDGKIFVTGQFLKAANGEGLNGWATSRLDPQTMAVTPVVKEPGYAQFDNGTSTVLIGNTLWIGTFRGDRIAYRAAP